MTVVDAGALDGAEPMWDAYGSALRLVGFEPSAAECARLNRATHLGQRQYVPLALDRVSGTRELRVTRYPGASSFLMPNEEFLRKFPQRATGEVTTREQVPTTDLDSWLDAAGIEGVDFLKVDVEGMELEALAGAKRAVSGALGISIETFFHPYHVGRPLFCDVDRYMRAEGFELMDLGVERWRRQAAGLPRWDPSRDIPAEWFGAGQVILAQAIYLRPVEDLLARSRDTEDVRLLKAASIAEVFGLADVAVSVLDAGIEARVVTGPDTGAWRAALVQSSQRQWKARVNRRTLLHRSRAAVKAAIPMSLRPAARSLYHRLKR